MNWKKGLLVGMGSVFLMTGCGRVKIDETIKLQEFPTEINFELDGSNVNQYDETKEKPVTFEDFADGLTKNAVRMERNVGRVRYFVEWNDNIHEEELWQEEDSSILEQLKNAKYTTYSSGYAVSEEVKWKLYDKDDKELMELSYFPEIKVFQVERPNVVRTDEYYALDLTFPEEFYKQTKHVEKKPAKEWSGYEEWKAEREKEGR